MKSGSSAIKLHLVSHDAQDVAAAHAVPPSVVAVENALTATGGLLRPTQGDFSAEAANAATDEALAAALAHNERLMRENAYLRIEMQQ